FMRDASSPLSCNREKGGHRSEAARGAQPSVRCPPQELTMQIDLFDRFATSGSRENLELLASPHYSLRGAQRPDREARENPGDVVQVIYRPRVNLPRWRTIVADSGRAGAECVHDRVGPAAERF